MLKRVSAGVLSVAYEESGSANGAPVLLLHGFPYDVHAYHEVTPLLVSAGVPRYCALPARVWSHPLPVS